MNKPKIISIDVVLHYKDMEGDWKLKRIEGDTFTSVAGAVEELRSWWERAQMAMIAFAEVMDDKKREVASEVAGEVVLDDDLE